MFRKNKKSESSSSTGNSAEKNLPKMAVQAFSKDKIRSFFRGENGNVAVLTIFAVTPMVLLSLGAIDVMRVATVRTEIQGAIDASLLSAARQSRIRPLRDDVMNYLERNIDPNLVDLDDITLTIVDNSIPNHTDITVDISYDLDAAFLGMGSGGVVEIEASGRAEQTTRTVEISLVLDVSSSMGRPKFDALKRASSDFVDEILLDGTSGDTTISVIPFGGTVNLGDDFLYAVDRSTIDSDDDGDTHRGFGGYLDHSDGHEWMGCFDIDTSDFGSGDFSPSANSAMPDFFAFPGENPWCPEAQSEALFISNNARAIKRRLRNMTRSDGTGMDVAAAIGFKALSPDLRGRFPGTAARGLPTDFGSPTHKIMVIMTDGEITGQFRPVEGCTRAGLDLTGAVRGPSSVTGSSCRAVRRRFIEAQARFEQLCRDIKAEGVVIYTIGFQIDRSLWSHAALGACPQSRAQYFHVEGLDIDAAFNSISASINGIRITE